MIRPRNLALATLSFGLIFGMTLSEAGGATAQEQGSMAERYEPKYESLETRLGASWSGAGLSNSASQSIENLAELPEGTRFLLESGTFADAIGDNLVTSRLDSYTGTIRHTLGGSGGISFIPGEMKRSYTDRVTVRTVYPDGSIDIVTPHSVIEVSDDIYYNPQSTEFKTVRNGQTVKIPLKVMDGQGVISGIPHGAKVVKDRHGSIENAELKGATILIDENTGELTFTAPEDRIGTLWFRTELIYPDGTYAEIHYSLEVTDKPPLEDRIPSFGSSLSS